MAEMIVNGPTNRQVQPPYPGCIPKPPTPERYRQRLVFAGRRRNGFPAGEHVQAGRVLRGTVRQEAGIDQKVERQEADQLPVVLRRLQIPGRRISDLSTRPHGSSSRAVELLRARDGIEDFNAQGPQRRQRFDQSAGDELSVCREKLAGFRAGERGVRTEKQEERRTLPVFLSPLLLWSCPRVSRSAW